MFKLFLCFACLFIFAIEPVLANSDNLHTSYFESQITAPSKEGALDLLAGIQLGRYKITSQTEETRLTKTQRFIYLAKKEAAKRYEEGEMNNYEMDDFARELGYLTHNMNEYFRNIVAAERTKNQSLRKLARQNLRDADASYGRLSAVTLASTRR